MPNFNSLLNPGLSGILSIENTYVKCNSFAISPSQNPLFYQHTIGLRDSIPSNNGSKGDDGSYNTQRGLWRPATIITEASLEYMATDKTNDLFEAAKFGNDINASFMFDCTPMTFQLTDFKIASYTLRLTAGDILNVSAQLMGSNIQEDQTILSDDTEEKLITWDSCGLSLDGLDVPYTSFEITISNNCIPIYTSGSLYPRKIRVGLQEVKGSVSFYEDEGLGLNWLDNLTEPKVISFESDHVSFDVKALWLPISRTSSITPVISTMGFEGIGKAFEVDNE